MEVERIQVRAFGRLRELDTGPDPLGRLVVVLGPNEAGKTTLFHFLSTLLYGFYPASRDTHSYAPWDGGDAEGGAQLRTSDGRPWEVHRRLRSSPSGSLAREGTSEELRNLTLPFAEHVPREVFRQLYAITLSELAKLEGESWARIQDRLVAALGAGDLRSPREVAEALEEEAGRLWKTHRRGNQEVRRVGDRLRELAARRREVAGADRDLRDRVRERERTLAELEAARAEREACEVYLERYGSLLPVRAALQRVRALEREAGEAAELDRLPADPAARLAELDARIGEGEARVEELERERAAPERRAAAFAATDAAALEQADAVDRLAARAHAAAPERSRAAQLTHQTRELERRMEALAADLFERWDGEVSERLRALSVRALRDRARAVEAATRERAVFEEARRRAGDPAGGPSPVAGGIAAALGVILVAWGLAAGGTLAAALGALALGAGGVLLAAALRRRRAGALGAERAAEHVERERAASTELEAVLAGLPLRAGRAGPVELAAACERLQESLRDRDEQEAELAGLREGERALAREAARLADACGLRVPDEPLATAHLLANAVAEATRRRQAAEDASAELERIERAVTREREALAGLEEERTALARALEGIGAGRLEAGLDRFRARVEARDEAARLIADLERAHPDLADLRSRIRDAEAAGDEWIVDDEALARRRVRLPELTARVESLARREAALQSDIEHLSAGETLDRVDGETEVLEDTARRLERERDRKYVLARLLREADRRFRDEHQPELVRRAGEHLATITAGRYDRLLLADEGGNLSFRVRSGDAPAPVPVGEPLSTGTREQVYLALRLAAIDQLDREGERLPLFLDEALVNWDPERRERGLALLASLARERQLFVFTCHPDAADALAARGARVVTLDPPR